MSVREYASDSGVIAYIKRGMGDPVVLLHGIYPGASHDEFAHNIAALQQQHTVYAIDLLGFGQSDVPRIAHTAQMHHYLVRNFIRGVIDQPVTLIASGASCGIAARLGVYDDGLIDKLILLAPVVKAVYKEPPGLADRFSRFLLGTLAAGSSLYEVEASVPGLAFWVRENYHEPEKILKAKVKALHLEANEHNKMMAHISLICGYFDTDLSHYLPYVRRKTLVIVGQDCMPVPTDAWFKPAQWSMGKRLEVIAAARGFPHEEQSAKANEIITAFQDEVAV